VPAVQPAKPARPDARSLDLASKDGRTGVLYGDVIIQSVPGDNSVLLGVDGGARAGMADGVLDQVFVLQRKERGVAAGRMKLSGARVFFEPKSVIVRPRDGAALGLATTDAQMSRSARAFLAGARMQDRWTGYGLGRRTGHWTMAGEYLGVNEAAALIPRCGRPVATPAGVHATAGQTSSDICDSGGAGSAGCSTSCPAGGSCSTSCADGFHSCCNKGKCECTCVAN
jgi:hypothetical protein